MHLVDIHVMYIENCTLGDLGGPTSNVPKTKIFSLFGEKSGRETPNRELFNGASWDFVPFRPPGFVKMRKTRPPEANGICFSNMDGSSSPRAMIHNRMLRVNKFTTRRVSRNDQSIHLEYELIDILIMQIANRDIYLRLHFFRKLRSSGQEKCYVASIGSMSPKGALLFLEKIKKFWALIA